LPNAIDISLLIAVILLVLIALYLLLRILRRIPGTGGPGSGGGTGGGSTGTAIPDQLTPAQLGNLLQARLTGTPASGGASSGGAAPAAVVWVDRGDEVLVHLDSTTIAITDGCVLVAIDLESDQTGRTPLVTSFALGTSAAAGLVVATDEFPRGNATLAARWGPAVQAAAWAALLSVAADHATERGQSPIGMTVSGGQLHLLAGEALRVT
jgi:hypothetical protein